MPAFRGASIAQSAACMDAGARELVARLGRIADSGPEAKKEVNIWRMMGEVTLDVVFRAAFGIELGTQMDEAQRPEKASKLIEAAKAVFEVGQRATPYFLVIQAVPQLRPLVRVLATLFPDAALRRVTSARALVFRTVEQLLAEKKRARAAAAPPPPSSSSPTSSSSSRPPSAVAPGCFIDSLLDATHDDGSPWSDDEIVEACLTFALAAYETTATAISFTVYGLCLNPDARAKVAAQLDARPVDEKTPAELLETFADDYPLVDASLAEALRLWPPGAITIRKAATDDDGRGNTEVFGTVSSSDGGSSSSLPPKRYLVPKGTWMHCCIWSIHRDAKVWPRAEEFLPERFVSPATQAAANKAAAAAAQGGEGEGEGKGGVVASSSSSSSKGRSAHRPRAPLFGVRIRAVARAGAAQAEGAADARAGGRDLCDADQEGEEGCWWWCWSGEAEDAGDAPTVVWIGGEREGERGKHLPCLILLSLTVFFVLFRIFLFVRKRSIVVPLDCLY